MAWVTPKTGAASAHAGGPGAFRPSDLPEMVGPEDVRSSGTARIVGVPRFRAAGLALRLDPLADSFTVVLIDEAGVARMRFGPFPEEEVVAIWRSLGKSSGLPLLLLLTDGRLEAPFPQLGRVQLGAIRMRRRHGLLNDRRPRFLTRRKVGRWPARPRVVRGRDLFDATR